MTYDYDDVEEKECPKCGEACKGQTGLNRHIEHMHKNRKSILDDFRQNAKAVNNR